MPFDALNNFGVKIREKGKDLSHIIVRTYGKFSTTKTGEIIKISNGEILPTDEPIYMIRGRDRLAVKTLEAYSYLSRQDGCNDWHMQKLEAQIEIFKQFAKENPGRMKQPSITKGE